MKELKSELTNLPHQELVADLIAQARNNPYLRDVLETIIAGAKDAEKFVKDKISYLRRSKRWYGYGSIGEYVGYYYEICSIIDNKIKNPDTALKLLKSLFDLERKAVESCDDDGDLTPLFHCTMTDLWVKNAKLAENKKFIVDVLLEYSKDSYCGLNQSIFKRAGEFFDKDTVLKLAEKIYNPENSTAKICSELLMYSSNDPVLYQEFLVKTEGSIKDYKWEEIAELYLKNGQYAEAEKSAQKLPEFRIYEKERLLKEIWKASGDTEKLKTWAREYFYRSPSKASVEELEEYCSKDEVESLIAEKMGQLKSEKTYSNCILDFVLAYGSDENLKEYVEAVRKTIGTQFYCESKRIKALEKKADDETLAKIYRPYIQAVLDEKDTKAYKYAAKRMCKLNENESVLVDGISHESFYSELYENHKRKTSFWGSVSF